MKHARQNNFRVIALGDFVEAVSRFSTQLVNLGFVLQPIAAIEQLPDLLSDNDILLTEMAWLESLPSEYLQELCRRSAKVAGWIALTDPTGGFKEQIFWQRLGVKYLFQKPLDLERLTRLVEDIHNGLNGVPLRAILLDDDQDSLCYYGEALRRDGLYVHVSRDPMQVLESFSEHKPDVLVLPIDMPDCLGQELVAIVRQLPVYAYLPVIYFDHMEKIQNIHFMQANGSETFIAKPVAPALLLGSIRSHVMRNRSSQLSSNFTQAKSGLSFENLRQAFDEHAIVSAADLEGNIIHVNDKFCAISGYGRDELLGQNHRLLKSGLHKTEFYDDLWCTIRNGDIWHGEICNRRKDGDIYWVEASICPVLDSVGRVSRYISIRTDITTLKASQTALHISEERLRRGQDFANIGTWEWNIETGDLYWSERIAPLFGYGFGELATSYENFLNILHPDDRQAVIDAVDSCIQHNTSYEIEHRVVWPDGSVRWLLERGAVTRDAQGNSLKMLGVVQDIDSRKRAELALAERERLLCEAQSLAHIGNWVANLRTGELAWSDEIYRIFGHEPGSFQPSMAAFKASVHPDDLGRVLASESRAIQSGVHDVIHRIVRPDGAVRHVHELARIERDMAGTAISFSGTVQDITERVESELRAQETEMRFAFAVEGAGDGVWDWNIRSGAMSFSGNYEGMLEYAKGEIQPTIDAWASSVHPNDFLDVKTALDEYLAGALPTYAIELRLRCKDGNYKWILCRGTVVGRDASGSPVRMIGIHSDINARKSAELALVEARKAADSANLAKSDFLSSMSHELRTPMNAIIGFAQILEYDSEMTADQQDNVHEILKAGRHLLDLINEVLDLAKIEAGSVNLSLDTVELSSLAEDCCHLLQPIANKAGIGLNIELPIGSTVFADRVRLKQVLINLISNAIKYNRPHGTVSLITGPGKIGHLRLAVVDTGQGIAQARIKELFQPFSRLGADASEVEGTGIGLTITRRLVEIMGGEMVVESTLGVGSIFWVELPLGHTAIKNGGDSESDMHASVKACMEGATVLAVDDNPANLKLIAKVISMRGNIRLVCAHTPELGIELALAHRPTLILLDINMAGMDGYQVLKILKANTTLRTIPVIAVTANAMPHDIKRGMIAGFADYLTKPIKISTLINTIDHWLEDRKEMSV